MSSVASVETTELERKKRVQAEYSEELSLIFIVWCSVIKIILQFCKENSLTDSFNTLQVGCGAVFCSLSQVAG